MSIAAKARIKLSRKVGHTLNNIKHALGANAAFYTKARGARILTYHGVCTEDHLRYNTIFLTRDVFEQHLKFYKKYCHIISLDEFYGGHFSTKKFNICLTFDDGFANNHNYVLPLLEQYQMPATFFITAICDAGHDILWNDFLGILGKHGPADLWFKYVEYGKDRHNKYIAKEDGTALADKLRSAGFADKAEMMEAFYHLYRFRATVDEDYWLQMTEQQIKELSASPWVTIGAHGYYHNDLARISLTDATDEMRRSKQYIEAITAKPVNSIAFPYGTYTPEVVEQAKHIGYSQLLGLEFLYPQDHHNTAMRERFTVNPFISVPNQMRAILKGSYEF